MKTQLLLIWLGSFALGALMFLPIGWAAVVLWAAVGIETAHALSPIALGWVSPLRAQMLEQPEWWLGLPALAIILAMTLPFGWVAVAFVWGNAWHFGMQNFGVLRLLGVWRWRWVLMGLCLLVTGAGMMLTNVTLVPRLALAVTMGLSINHWITDLGLTRLASPRGWLLLGAVLLAGVAGYLCYDMTPRGVHKTSEFAARCLFALGFVHFLYSRWVWQHGRELLAAAHEVEILMVDSTIRFAR